MSTFQTRRARLAAMIAGQKVDYLPSQLDFVPHRLNCLLEELDMSFDEFNDFACNHVFHIFPLTEACYYSSGSSADEQMAQMAVEKGLIRQNPDNSRLFDNFGVPWLKNKTGVMYVDHPIKDKNLDAIEWPSADLPGIFDHLIEPFKKYRDEFYVIGLQHLTVHERSYLLVGYENFMTYMASDPDFIAELMDRIVDFHVGLARRFVELGVDAVRTGDDFGTQRGLQMPPALWRKLYKPRLARLWQVYKEAGITVMHHSCGCVEEVIPDMIEIGLELLHPVQPLAMSIEKLAKEYGDKIAFHGGIDTQQLLPYGTPKQVKDAVKHCVDTLGANGQYLIAPSQEIMNDVPTENILALIEAIKEYR
jgi:uroporphyrinogen decarboxylase